MAQGILLFAHGARDPDWARPFEAVLERIRAASPDVRAELAYLEFMSPRLAEVLASLAAASTPRVRVLPVFISRGGQVKAHVLWLVA